MIQIYPYVRGFSPRHSLAALWSLMEEDGATGQVFAVDTPLRDRPVSTQGDVVGFVEYFAAEGHGQTKLILVCEETAHNEIIGMVWFDRIQSPHSAFANVWHRKKYRGKIALEASRMCLAYGFAEIGWKRVWALTSWPTARWHAAQLGFATVALLPEFFVIDGTPTQAWLLTLTEEMFHGKSRED